MFTLYFLVPPVRGIHDCIYTRIADQLAGRRRARASTRVIRMGLGEKNASPPEIRSDAYTAVVEGRVTHPFGSPEAFIANVKWRTSLRTPRAKIRRGACAYVNIP